MKVKPTNMKRLVFLTCIILFLGSSRGFCQNERIIETVKYKFSQNRDSVPREKNIDTYNPTSKERTRIRKIWDTSKADWKDTLKTEYSYNSADREERATFYDYNISTQTWVEKWKFEYLYSKLGNDSIIFKYIWDKEKSRWINNVKAEKNYNTNKMIVLNAEYYWSEESNKWIGNFKYQYKYDSQNNMTSKSYMKWDNTLNNWAEDNLIEYVYDSHNRVTSRIVLSYNKITNEWTGTERAEIKYYEGRDEEITYKWDNQNNKWINNTKTEAFYINGEVLDYKIKYTWYLTEWIGNLKYEYEFDQFNNLANFITSGWNKSKKVWEYISKIEEIYLTENLILYDSYSAWDLTNNRWKYLTKNEYIYDKDQNILCYIESTWNENLFRFIVEYKTYYNNILTTTKSEIHKLQNLYIYPNPSSDYINIKGIKYEIEDIKIYNSLGLMQEIIYDLNNNELTLDIRKLPTGVYFTKITYNHWGLELSKFIKH